jgi:predicted MFS family arabinose efflux permease
VFAGSVAVPPLLGLVADHSGWRAAWLGACALGAFAAVAMTIAVLAQAREAGLESSDLLQRKSREAT